MSMERDSKKTLNALVAIEAFFVTFICIRVGKVIARGAHSTEPTRPRNLSILLAKTSAIKIALAVTTNREKF